jgi:hypothetical protein
MSSLRIILLATVCLTLAACDQYMAERYLVRRDTVTSSSGNAVATNSAVQIPDPWPRGSNNPNIAFDGEKISRAVKRYREGQPGPQSSAGGTPPPEYGSSPGAGSGMGAGTAPPAGPGY